MIATLGEDVAYAMCMGCPVPKVASDAFCHMVKGWDAFEKGNLCLLREINRRQKGILRTTEPRPYHNDDAAKASLDARRKELLGDDYVPDKEQRTLSSTDLVNSYAFIGFGVKGINFDPMPYEEAEHLKRILEKYYTCEVDIYPIELEKEC